MIKFQDGKKRKPATTTSTESRPSLIRTCWFLLAIGLVLPATVLQGQVDQSASQEASANDPSPIEIRNAFRAGLKQLEAECIQQKLPEQAARVGKLMQPRDPNRQYIFMPPAFAENPDETATDSQKQFQQKLASLKKEHAEALFQAARNAVTAAQGPEAYQLLHELLVFDPDHAQTRAALGFRQDAKLGWVRSTKPTRATEARKRQKAIGWEKGTYWEINSPHFTIASAAGEQAGLKLAAELELTYWVWRQVYFDYWANPRQLENWLNGKGKDKNSGKKYSVVLFRDRQQYVAEMARLTGTDQVAISSGYYEEKIKTSFFYAADEPPVATWRHESIHQFLQENAGVNKTVADRGHAWLVEAIAMYFESMKVHDTHTITLGGFDAERLQFARLRCKREGKFVPMQELDELGRRELQSHADVAALYTQASGIGQFLFTAENGKYRNGFIRFIKEFYQARRVKSSLAEHTLELDQLDRKYKEFLNVTAEDLAHPFFNINANVLTLGRAKSSNAVLPVLKQCTNLSSLELSENRLVDDASVEYLAEMNQIAQLFLDATGITDASLPTLAKLTSLQELDLASNRITDAQISRLAELPELQLLYMAGSLVSDACIDDLARIPKLKLVDLRKTRVTEKGAEKLKQLLPNVRILH